MKEEKKNRINPYGGVCVYQLTLEPVNVLIGMMEKIGGSGGGMIDKTCTTV